MSRKVSLYVICIKDCKVQFKYLEQNNKMIATHSGCPVLATWHRNCSSTGQVSLFPFFSKSGNVHMKNRKSVNNPNSTQSRTEPDQANIAQTKNLNLRTENNPGQVQCKWKSEKQYNKQQGFCAQSNVWHMTFYQIWEYSLEQSINNIDCQRMTENQLVQWALTLFILNFN